MLRLPVHTSQAPYSQKHLTAIETACSYIQRPHQQLETKTQTTRICRNLAPKLHKISRMQPDDKNKCGVLSAAQTTHVSQPPREQLNVHHLPPTPSLNVLANTCKFCPLTPERFHVLFNSLFKVLFNFPSRYLFAIGLVVIFSLRWSLPPDLGCTPKQPDSKDEAHRKTIIIVRA